MQSVDLALVKEYAGKDANFMLSIYQKLLPKIAAQGLEKLLLEVESPLVNVLAAMEQAGVKVYTDVQGHVEMSPVGIQSLLIHCYFPDTTGSRHLP